MSRYYTYIYVIKYIKKQYKHNYFRSIIISENHYILIYFIMKKDTFLIKHIVIILIVKVILIWILWFLFFSEPVAKKMFVPIADMDTHIMQ
jgi:hypothetical protein